ncbi:MAG: hypothetical protein ACRDOK_21245, partial [Streptosporangiaceae bacterium]
MNSTRVATRHASNTSAPRMVITALALTVLVAGVATMLHAAGARRRPATPMTVRARQPAAGVTVLPGSPAATSAGLATLLFARTPAVVVANAASPADVAAAAAIAGRAHAPLLLSPARRSAGDAKVLQTAIRSLRPEAVL